MIHTIEIDSKVSDPFAVADDLLLEYVGMVAGSMESYTMNGITYVEYSDQDLRDPSPKGGHRQVLEIRRDQVHAIDVNTFVTEASDLGIRAGMPYPRVISIPAKDGSPVLFCFRQSERDQEGDLVSSWYESYTIRGRYLRLQVFND